MIGKTSLVVLAVIALAVGGAVSPLWAIPTQPRPQPVERPTPPASDTQLINDIGRDSQMGGMDDMMKMEHMPQMMRVDSTMHRMNSIMEESKTLSKHFADLAELHHGADKTEILTKQRMSDSLEMMAGEVNAILRQYKEMLRDETASDPGQMKDEIESLRGIIQGMAKQIDAALGTLRTLQAQLGQG